MLRAVSSHARMATPARRVAAGLGCLVLVVAFERFDSASVVILVAAAAAPGGLVLALRAETGAGAAAVRTTAAVAGHGTDGRTGCPSVRVPAAVGSTRGGAHPANSGLVAVGGS
jgi:hypothetical protein